MYQQAKCRHCRTSIYRSGDLAWRHTLTQKTWCQRTVAQPDLTREEESSK